jgi:hypothetical protein
MGDYIMTRADRERKKMSFKIRHAGTSEFVSKITLTRLETIESFHGNHVVPGVVRFVKGWDNDDALVFDSVEEAEIAQKQVEKIEQVRTTIEEI